MKKTHNKKLFVVLVMIIVVSTITIASITNVAHASFSVESWQYYRDISLPTSGSSSFVKFELPSDISRWGNNFADIRIENQDDTEIPYMITQNALVRGGETSARILDQTTSSKIANSNTTFFIADTYSPGKITTGLVLDTVNANFRCQVSVYSSSQLISINDSAWNIVTNKGFIFRFTDQATGYTSGKTNVDFSPNTSRYFKVIINCGEDSPVTVNSVNVYSDRSVDIPTYSQSLPTIVSNDVTKHTTDVVVDLGSSGHITNAITLYPVDTNYSRRVIVESTDNASDTSSWIYVGQSSISSISTSLFSGVSNRVTYPDQKKRYIRISIVNDDNRPLSVSENVLVEGPIYSAIFEIRPSEQYRLYYGNPSATQPTYDISSISSYIETNHLPQASIREEKENPSYITSKGPVVPFTEANKGLLNAVLLIVVIILGAGIGWYVYRYTKKA